MGRYGEQLWHVLDLFPREQVLVLRHEDMVADAAAVLGRVHAFLGVPELPPTADPDPHRSGEPRIKFLSRVMSTHHPLKKVVSPLGPLALRRRIRRQVVRRNIVRSTYREETRRALVETFRDDVELLEQLTGLHLSAWRDPAPPSRGRA